MADEIQDITIDNPWDVVPNPADVQKQLNDAGRDVVGVSIGSGKISVQFRGSADGLEAAIRGLTVVSDSDYTAAKKAEASAAFESELLDACAGNMAMAAFLRKHIPH
jgi:hypothetical protein